MDTLIRFPKVLVIDNDGTSLGEMSSRDAMMKAREKNLNLLCVAPNAKVPVCKIVDYGKYRYERQKKEKEAKKNQTIIKVKELELSPSIQDHDLEVKKKAAEKWLDEGNKVKIKMKFKGRQLTHPEEGQKIIDKLMAMLGDKAFMEKSPVLDKKTLIVILASKVKK